MQDRSGKLRAFFASLVAGQFRGRRPAIEQAFATVERERFAGPGPWSIMVVGSGYMITPDDDPAFLYQDTLVALDPDRGINIGQPSWHALWLDAVDVRRGETVLQVGAGTGYYTAILAQLVGPNGRVHAYEIDPGLAARASKNLEDLRQIEVKAQSAIADDLPKADVIYVCAGVTQPSWAWLDAMRTGARMLFPLQSPEGVGGMLLLTRPAQGPRWPARFVSRARFVCCDGLQDPDAGRRLSAAFSSHWDQVKSFRIDDARDDTCWYAGDGWWLSTAAVDTETVT
jgi:protein-L-isoaspartate(D-aspartate) O-methyltransferase